MFKRIAQTRLEATGQVTSESNSDARDKAARPTIPLPQANNLLVPHKASFSPAQPCYSPTNENGTCRSGDPGSNFSFYSRAVGNELHKD